MNAIGEQISAILWNIFNRPRLIDLIDILLLTIIIYELLVNVRQTRVSQMLKGILILLAATWLSDILGMRTIHALLAWMINAGPVLLIVLFQSEIRRILEELGNNSVFDSSALSMREGNTELIIDEMILALEHMARRKVGALIVVENKIHLNDVIATGTRVDGIISQPLIENIFEPNTPRDIAFDVYRDSRRLTGIDRSVDLRRIGDAQLILSLAFDLRQIKMRVVSRAADAVVVCLRHLDRHLDRRNKLCDIVHDDIAAALERCLACHADRHVRKDLLPRQRTIRRDQRAPADDCRQQ